MRDENTKFFIRLTSSGKSGKMNSATHSIVSAKNILESSKEGSEKDKNGVASLGSDIQIETLSPTKYHSQISFAIKPTETQRSQTSQNHDQIDQKPVFALLFILLLVTAYRFRTNISSFLNKK